MREKRSIVALDFAVSEFVAALNQLFCGYVIPWDTTNGMNIEVKTRHAEPEFERVTVFIFPVGWPTDDYIGCTLDRYSPRPWHVIDATICASHVGFNHLHVDCDRSAFGASYSFEFNARCGEREIIERCLAQPHRPTVDVSFD